MAGSLPSLVIGNDLGDEEAHDGQVRTRRPWSSNLYYIAKAVPVWEFGLLVVMFALAENITWCHWVGFEIVGGNRRFGLSSNAIFRRQLEWMD